jgi:hypothetical protein
MGAAVSQDNTESNHEWRENGRYNGPERRSRADPAHTELIRDIIDAVSEGRRPLSDDERQWVRLAIQREAQSVQLRRAIIEKTLGGLVWAGIIGLGVMLVNYLKTHGVDLTR